MSLNSMSNQLNISDTLAPTNNKPKVQDDGNDVNSLKNMAAKIEAFAVKETQEQLNLEEVEKKDQAKEELVALEQDPNLLTDAMKTISEFINMPVRTVNFTQDDGSARTVIKIFDSESKELIKQFPSDEILSIAQRIIELRQDVSQRTGILLDEKI